MFYSFQADFYMCSVNGIDRGYLNIGFYFAQGTVSYNLVKLSILTLVFFDTRSDVSNICYKFVFIS